MKRLLSGLLILLMVLTLASCSKKGGPLDSFDIPGKDEVAPYKLSEKEKELLKVFGIDINGNAQVFSLRTPKGTKAVEVYAYVLRDDLSWESIDGIAVFSDDKVPIDSQEGLLSMLLREDYTIDFCFTLGNGDVTFKSNEIEDYAGHKASYKAYLPASQEIEFDKEIPVAILVYDSGTSMRSYAPGQYFTPSDFEGMDLVQAVTLKFSDKEFTPPAQ